jgi:hypothetical protein
MKAIVKSIWLDSVSADLGGYMPEDAHCFGLWIEFRVGIAGEEGADDFRLWVCTSDWLKNECDKGRAVWARHTLVVSNYDLENIKKEINSLVEKCVGDSWTSIAQNLAKFAAWEYEGVSLS